MCMSPDCSHLPQLDLDSATRRDVLKKMVALGLTLPLASSLLDTEAKAGPMSFMNRSELVDGLKSVIANANSSELTGYRIIELSSTDMPWKDLGISARKGQEITFLLGGRVWVSREHDIWFEPGICFNARTKDRRPLYNPMNNTGTMTAAGDGPIQIARALAEWKNEDGELWTPVEAYKQTEVKIYGLALVWNGSALKGLKSLIAQGDVGGIIGAEIARLESPRKLPEGWDNFYMASGCGPIIFNDAGNGVITCQAYKKGGILQRQVSVDLRPGTKLNWRWIVEELPSAHPEDQIVTHDYLSVGAEYDDGQDLTYIWSAGLLAGKDFRCPFPRWNPIETHMVVRSGTKDLGTWLSEERDLYADYQTHIAGNAKKVVRVWLLGISLFQRRMGACRFADVKIATPKGKAIRL